ncbi:MAG: N-acetylmuramoyl-L-alanine amidase [Lachnospiraceae bacterium]|nr:N-acetylmuramoyl-L-alanine amidase [Lachnospiraceae bacterium]MCR5086469.1 N-acetylmuramoyl-L-alanine amidase [Lachnospiraceae bacterium]
MRKTVLLLAMALCSLALCACGKNPDDDDLGYYTKVGSYDEDGNGTYKAGEKDIVSGGKFSDDGTIPPTDTPTPTPLPTFVVVLDPGHGAKFGGAVYGRFVEKTLNLTHAKLLKEYLETHYDNVTVYLTRSDDTIFFEDNSKDLRARVEFAKEKNADIMISMHLNSSEYHNAFGSMVCISKQPNITGNSEALAKCLLAKLEGMGLKNRGPYKKDSLDTKDSNGVPVDYYAINRHGADLGVVAVILESCYLDNDADVQYIETDEAIARMAAQEAEGIMEFLMTQYRK